jgi:hypothetical protein
MGCYGCGGLRAFPLRSEFHGRISRGLLVMMPQSPDGIDGFRPGKKLNGSSALKAFVEKPRCVRTFPSVMELFRLINEHQHVCARNGSPFL